MRRLRRPPAARAAARRGLRLRRRRADRRRHADRDARLRLDALHEGVDQEEAVTRATRSCACCSAATTSRRATAAASCRRSTASAGGHESGRRADWFYYVNGIEAPVGAAERRVSGGRARVVGPPRRGTRRSACRRWSARSRSRSVSGTEGKRFPVRLVCAGDDERSCDEVQTRLERRRREGALARGARAVRRPGGPARHRRPLGRRPARPGRAPARARPAASGVFARPTSTGDAIVLLDDDGQPVRTLRAGAGLVAATQRRGAGADLDRHRHRRRRRRGGRGARSPRSGSTQHFALAIDGGHDVPLPVAGPGTGP